MTLFPYMVTSMTGKIRVSPSLSFSLWLQSIAFTILHFNFLKRFKISFLLVSQCYVCSLLFYISQASWASLRTEFAALNPAQLHHMLREYSSGKACPTGWTPTQDDAMDAVRTGEWQRQAVLELAQFVQLKIDIYFNNLCFAKCPKISSSSFSNDFLYKTSL